MAAAPKEWNSCFYSWFTCVRADEEDASGVSTSRGETFHPCRPDGTFWRKVQTSAGGGEGGLESLSETAKVRRDGI